MPRPAPRLFALAALALAACGDPAIFDRVSAPESADVADAAYPALASVPEAPPAGAYDADSPDPATGEAALIELQASAQSQEARRKKVLGPVE